MDTSFSYAMRVLACEQCGAPFRAAPAGGVFRCDYCGAQTRLSSRDERPTMMFAAVAPTQLPEPERVARLRAQDGRPLLPPAELAPLLQPGGEVAPWKVNEALAVWQGARARLKQGPDFAAAEQLSFLTMALANHYAAQHDVMRQRAMFESALEVFTLPRHRQDMLGYLARNAARLGDLEAAEQWLARCDPRSDDLQSDSSYRFSRAFLDTVAGRHGAVLEVLGPSPEAVPIHDAMDTVCAVLRANAHERLGRVDVAAQLLAQLMQTQGPPGRQALERILRVVYAPLGLCAQSYPRALQQHGAHAGGRAAASVGGGVGAVLLGVGGLLLVIGVALIVVGVTVADDVAALLAPGFSMMLPGAILSAIGFAMFRAARRAAWLRVNGVQAPAQVTGVRGTGTRINGVPLVELSLAVQPAGQAPFTATSRLLLSAGAHAMAPGATVSVRYDPREPQRVLIETD